MFDDKQALVYLVVRPDERQKVIVYASDFNPEEQEAHRVKIQGFIDKGYVVRDTVKAKGESLEEAIQRLQEPQFD